MLMHIHSRIIIMTLLITLAWVGRSRAAFLSSSSSSVSSSISSSSWSGSTLPSRLLNRRRALSFVPWHHFSGTTEYVQRRRRQQGVRLLMSHSSSGINNDKSNNNTTIELDTVTATKATESRPYSHTSSSSTSQASSRSPSSGSLLTTKTYSLSPRVGRYDQVLRELHLDQHVSLMEQVHQLPAKRVVKSTDIFCNRELNMSTIKAIGFDMDYTLAQYNETTFAQLAFDGAKRKLVYNLGYPEAVLDLEYDPTLWARGLIIDTQRGNFLKIDRHKYVRVAYHGFDRISSTTRKHLYARTFNKVMSFTEKHFVNMDTLFQFVDAHLFASLITMKDQGDYEVLDYKTYEDLYRQVRECVDLCHRDGVIKQEVHRNPEPYIIHDPGMVPMLRGFREQGIKVFLLTNSLWEYTSTAMNFLYHDGKRVSDEQQARNEWMELFDLIIVGSCKPAYMLDPYLNLFRVHPVTGYLQNTDGIYEIDALGPNGATKFLQQGKVFQGGNWLHLQAMLEIAAGEEILYVGDHLYSDVLRSKRTLGWRSAFIMPELELEMQVFAEQAVTAQQITALRQLREELQVQAETLRRQVLPSSHANANGDNEHGANGGADPSSTATATAALAHYTHHDAVLKETLRELTRTWHAAFHPVWGAMFHAGYQDSRFAFYVQNYACLYTSRASNLGLVSAAHRSFRTTMEMLTHDRTLYDSDHTLFEMVSSPNDDDVDDE